MKCVCCKDSEGKRNVPFCGLCRDCYAAGVLLAATAAHEKKMSEAEHEADEDEDSAEIAPKSPPIPTE